jgi:hypothetical protein
MKRVVFGQGAKSVCVEDKSTKTPPSYLHVPALVVCAWHRTWHCYTISCGRYDWRDFLFCSNGKWYTADGQKHAETRVLVTSQFMSMCIAVSTISARMDWQGSVS